MVTKIEDPKAALKRLPSFSSPGQDPDRTPGQDPMDPPSPSASDDFGSYAEPGTPRRDTSDTRTQTSDSTGRPTKKQTAELIAGLIGLAFVGAGLVVRWRTRRKLRKPTDAQTDAMADPLADIASRHADLSWLNKDLNALIRAGAALGDYLSDGPLLEGPADILDDGIPDDLQESQS